MRRKYSRSKVKNAKKSTYKGLEFKSNLELHCYKKLEEAKIPVKYEKETFTIFPAMPSTFILKCPAELPFSSMSVCTLKLLLL